MKIGFVLDDGLDNPDGVQQYILTLGAELTDRGHEVSYLAGETKNGPKGIKIHSLSKNIKVRFNGNALSVPLPASKKNIKKVLAEEKFDVLHVQMPHSPFMGAKVVKYSSPSCVVIGTFHILPYGRLSRYGTELLGFVLRANLKRFDSFVSVSQPAADFALSSFKIKSRIIPNMVDTGAFKGPPKTANPNIKLLFLGRLVYRKGCLQLLKSLAIIKSQDKLPASLELDICGDGPMRAELEGFAKDSGLQENVAFRGFVTQQEKIRFMRAADVSVFPSLAGESFGIVLIEAMAAGGGVVLGGDNPGYASVMSEVPGSTLNSAKPHVMAAQLLEIIEDGSKRKHLYELQQEHVKQFDVKAVTDRILSIYETCKKQKINQ